MRHPTNIRPSILHQVLLAQMMINRWSKLIITKKKGHQDSKGKGLRTRNDARSVAEGVPTFQQVFNEVKADSSKWLRLLGPDIQLHVFQDRRSGWNAFLISASYK
jgi:hypothetical protein